MILVFESSFGLLYRVLVKSYLVYLKLEYNLKHTNNIFFFVRVCLIE
jgi:hypothetical protein